MARVVETQPGSHPPAHLLDGLARLRHAASARLGEAGGSLASATETAFAAFGDRISHPEFSCRTSGQTGCGATLSPAPLDSGLSTPLRTGRGC